ncbi:MAG: hypothetical protein RI928_708 [Pseudomonadota bacterium]
MNPTINASSSRESNSVIHRTTVQAPRPVRKIAQENLIHAIQSQDDTNFDAILDKALSEGASLDSVDENGYIPLELAAIGNKPRIVQSLLSRGSSMPVVPPNGFDLAMLAASQGHTALLLILLDVGDMLPNCQDNWGATPLHYAVIGGHLQSAEVLLDRGADTEIYTTCVVDPALRRRSCIPDIVSNAGTTPLMLAVALKNYALTDFLLSRGASPLGGIRHPLEIAVHNNDFLMLELLLNKNIDPNTIRLMDGRSLLTFSIENHCSLTLIKELLLSIACSPGGLSALDVPLQTAVQTGQHDVVACLLCQGAKPESSPISSNVVWTLAANLSDQGKMLNILIANRADEAIKIFTNGGVSLSALCEFASQPATFSLHGIFPAVLAPALPALQLLQSQLQELSPAQIQFEVAYCLYLLKIPQEGANPVNLTSLENILNLSDEIELIKSIPKKMTAQAKELQKMGQKVVIDKQNVLASVLSRGFFEAVLKRFGATSQFPASVAHKLRKEDGLPNPVAELIASAWFTAYEKTQQVPIDSGTPNSLSQHTETRMMLVMENKLLNTVHGEKMKRNVDSFCLNALLNSVTRMHSPIHQFVSDPVRFLQEATTIAAKKTLSKQQFVALLCTQLGLSVTTCQKIHNAWEMANADTATAFPAGHPEDVHEFLSQTMAASLKRILVDSYNIKEADELGLPSRLRDRLSLWCDTILASQYTNEANSSDDQRPAKRRRFNE